MLPEGNALRYTPRPLLDLGRDRAMFWSTPRLGYASDFYTGPITLAAFLLAAGCIPMDSSGGRGATATKAQLLKRASFDLRCPRNKLDVDFLNSQTAAVEGCAIRATYIERCRASLGAGGQVRRHDCIWVLNNTNRLVTADGKPNRAQITVSNSAPPKPKTRPGPVPVKRRIAKVKGHLSTFVPPVPIAEPAASLTRAAIRARIYGLRRCYNNALLDDRCLSGRARLSFTILPSGKLSNVIVTSPMTASFVRCIRTYVKGWHLSSLPRAVAIGPFLVKFRPIPKCTRP